MQLIEEVRPDIVNVTRFSPRPGTKAEGMAGATVGWQVKERSRQMTALRFRISREIHTSFEGRVLEAITTERGRGGTTLARTASYKQLVLRGELPLGIQIKAKVTQGRDIDLLAEVIDRPRDEAIPTKSRPQDTSAPSL